MYEYLPWSKKELINTINAYKDGQLSILDIELSGRCNFHCKYCDSPDRTKDFHVDLEKIYRQLATGKIRWIYICGLGEPTFERNGKTLLKLLSFAEEFGVKCSIFTNLSNLTSQFLEYVDKGILYLLFKMDSLDSVLAGSLYGTTDPIRQISNVKSMASHVKLQDGCTNLAASIVPTRKNIHEIPGIAHWCIEHNIYPLIAELENAGEGENVFQQLDPGKEQLSRLKWKLFMQNGDELRVPICPAMIGGLHINHDGVITTDKKTGFSCHWFWLEAPEVKQIADFNYGDDWDTYSENIINYRKSRIEYVRKCLENCEKMTYVFGGCGGSVEDILLGHLALHSEEENGDLC